GETRPWLSSARAVRPGDAGDNSLLPAKRLESSQIPKPCGSPGRREPKMMEVIMELQGKRAAVLVEQMYQEMEVWYPVYRLREAGCKVMLVGPEAGQTYPSKLGYPAKSDKAARDVSADDFDLLIIPGGYAPDHMRRCEAMIRL